nr:ABC transporter substrate-binding protein [Kibdelosporangium sp. MJ126-NF4]CEL18162.1 Hydroxymethylpyrimidine ABC transporter, substrate-binding component [Kibdelosporangium sp. MJ126-NF4]CTQ90608.1 Hydroxymethylpyrimidine ABC transporter, substrate-binding component [Kibdelosporangium sp. MJ126-NF4]
MSSLRQVGLAVITMTALVACGTGDKPAGNGQGTNVTYLTSFNTFGRDAYAFVAQEKGFFAEAGVNTTIKPGTGTVDVLKLVAAGTAQFGIADSTASMITMTREKLPVTAVAAIHQRTVAAIMSLDGNGIGKPADLVGKKIGDQPGSTNQVMFPMYAKAAGIDASKVQWVPSPPPNLPQLLVAGQVDGIGQFVVGKPLIEAAARNRKAVVLPYGELLPDLYGNVLVTSKDLAAKNPDLVRKFSGALLKGLRYSLDHPDELGRILRKHQPTQDPGVAAAEMRLMAPFAKPDGFTGPLGALEEKRVEKIIHLLTEAGAIPASALTPAGAADFALAPKS